MSGVNEALAVPVSVEEALQEEEAELYHSTATVLDPTYVTVAVRAFAVCPTS